MSSILRDSSNEYKLRVILVGIGCVHYSNPIQLTAYLALYFHRGATCSGKTTLAKHLRNILPGSVILHQDVRRAGLRSQ